MNWTKELPTNFDPYSLKPYYVIEIDPTGKTVGLFPTPERLLPFYKRHDDNTPNSLAFAPAEEVFRFMDGEQGRGPVTIQPIDVGLVVDFVEKAVESNHQMRAIGIQQLDTLRAARLALGKYANNAP